MNNEGAPLIKNPQVQVGTGKDGTTIVVAHDDTDHESFVIVDHTSCLVGSSQEGGLTIALPDRNVAVNGVWVAKETIVAAAAAIQALEEAARTAATAGDVQ